MVNIKETFSQLVETSIFGFVTKVITIVISIWLDKYINHNVSNFIGLTLNATADFFMMKHVFKVEEEESTHFIPRYTISIVLTVITAQILYMATSSYTQKHHKKWYKEKWNKHVFFIRYVIGAIAYGFLEFPLHKFWVFKK